jgi:hypothetical protein
VPVTTTTTRRPATDAVLGGAVEVARACAVEVADDEGHVGEHLGFEIEDERLVTHSFACLNPAYRGWRWAVTVTRAPRARSVTVAEAVLLPGTDALLAPEWVPWSERLQAGDLGVGDLLPTSPDDERLEPGYAQAPAGVEDDGVDQLAVWELGLGRERVLSPIGRDDAVDRWYSGAHGPHAPIAEAAPARCSTCGFLTLMAGSLRRVFGVCTNEYSPSDGRVVSFDHGCGAHSGAAVVPAGAEVSEHVVDEVGYDAIALNPAAHDDDPLDDAAAPEDLGDS